MFRFPFPIVMALGRLHRMGHKSLLVLTFLASFCPPFPPCRRPCSPRWAWPWPTSRAAAGPAAPSASRSFRRARWWWPPGSSRTTSPSCRPRWAASPSPQSRCASSAPPCSRSRCPARCCWAQVGRWWACCSLPTAWRWRRSRTGCTRRPRPTTRCVRGGGGGGGDDGCVWRTLCACVAWCRVGLGWAMCAGSCLINNAVAAALSRG